MTDLPLGPVVDASPRPLPVRARLAGRHMVLEPLHRRHANDLWEAADGAGQSWTYLPYGPFATKAELIHQIDQMASRHDPVMWVVRPYVSGQACGWLGLMNIEPENAAIELGHIWFSPMLRRTRAATEAMALLLRYAADDLGYRRLVWKCDRLNALSCAAAQRLGFEHEGNLRAHRVVKGHQRDTALYSIVPPEWPIVNAALTAWLDESNFAPDGTALKGLGELRHSALRVV